MRNSLRATKAPAAALSQKLGVQLVRTAALATVSSLGIDKATGITKPVSATDTQW